MKYKVDDLEDSQLFYAICKLEDCDSYYTTKYGYDYNDGNVFKYLLTKYKVNLLHIEDEDGELWNAYILDHKIQVPDHEGGTMPKYSSSCGDMAQEAVARVVVKHKFGEEVEL